MFSFILCLGLWLCLCISFLVLGTTQFTAITTTTTLLILVFAGSADLCNFHLSQSAFTAFIAAVLLYLLSSLSLLFYLSPTRCPVRCMLFCSLLFFHSLILSYPLLFIIYWAVVPLTAVISLCCPVHRCSFIVVSFTFVLSFTNSVISTAVHYLLSCLLYCCCLVRFCSFIHLCS